MHVAGHSPDCSEYSNGLCWCVGGHGLAADAPVVVATVGGGDVAGGAVAGGEVTGGAFTGGEVTGGGGGATEPPEGAGAPVGDAALVRLPAGVAPALPTTTAVPEGAAPARDAATAAAASAAGLPGTAVVVVAPGSVEPGVAEVALEGLDDVPPTGGTTMPRAANCWVVEAMDCRRRLMAA